MVGTPAGPNAPDRWTPSARRPCPPATGPCSESHDNGEPPPEATRWRAAALAFPVSHSGRVGAVSRLVARNPTVEAHGWDSAVSMNMVTGKTVEAFANEVGRHRMVRGSDTAQVPPALNRPKAISVRRDILAG